MTPRYQKPAVSITSIELELDLTLDHLLNGLQNQATGAELGPTFAHANRLLDAMLLPSGLSTFARNWLNSAIGLVGQEERGAAAFQLKMLRRKLFASQA